MAQFRRMARRGALTLAATLFAGTVQAQTPPSTPGAVLSSPFDVSACLCLEREIATRQSEMTVRRNAYEALAREITEHEAAISRDRSKVDVDDPAQIEAFKRRLEALDAMKARQDQITFPDYQQAVASYNARVAQYTQRCAGHTLDPLVVESVRGNLVCKLDQ